MRYGSVCSGIEAATVAWHGLGWKPVFFSEIEKFPCAILKHHYSEVVNLGDMTKHKEWKHEKIDLLVGGTPCQSFSIAGLRKGLADPRGNLMLTFLGLAERTSPKWIVWENVPGVLSADKGRAFATFLGALSELGYGWAYRVLDAQYFGVAQRRRRVFVVGYLGDWRRAATVLFEPESLCGNTPTRRKKREQVAPESGESSQRGEPSIQPLMLDDQGGSQMRVIAGGVTPTLRVQTHGHLPLVSATLSTKRRQSTDETFVPVVCGTLNASGAGTSRPAGQCNELDFCVPATFKVRCGCEGGGKGFLGRTEQVMTLSTTHDQDLFYHSGVRRLTPVECERLQGFPDGYTDIPGATDTTRYKALGNSMAVPVMKWIGQRIQKLED